VKNGKTFRSNNYTEFHGSFNSLKNHKYKKIFTRRIQRRLNKKRNDDEIYFNLNYDEDCHFIYNEMNVKHTKHIKIIEKSKPWRHKIGYIPNTDFTFDDLIEEIKIYYCDDNNVDILSKIRKEVGDVKKFDEIKKLFVSDGFYSGRLYHIINRMKKQMKRRNKIGHFIGHDKNKSVIDE